MEPADFNKLIQGLSDEDITADQPHVAMRCEENGITLDYLKRVLHGKAHELIRVVEDRPNVYKLYYKLSRRTELKIIADLFVYRKLNIRTVKRLSSKFRLGSVKRRRF